MKTRGFTIVEILISAAALSIFIAAIMKLVTNDANISRARTDRFRASLAGKSVAEAIGSFGATRSWKLLKTAKSYTTGGVNYWDRAAAPLDWLQEFEKDFNVRKIYLRESTQVSPAPPVYYPGGPAIANVAALQNSLRTIEVTVEYNGARKNEVLTETTLKSIPAPGCSPPPSPPGPP